MTKLRFIFALLLGGLIVGSGLFAAGAGAVQPYPPTVPASLQVSTTTPFQGQTIKVSGSNFGPSEPVRLTIGGLVVGVVNSDATGSFDPPVVVPSSLLGPQPVVGVGQTSGLTASLMLTVRAVPAAASSTGGSGLAFTGAQIGAALALAVILLATGAAFAVSGRRRRVRSN